VLRNIKETMLSFLPEAQYLIISGRIAVLKLNIKLDTVLFIENEILRTAITYGLKIWFSKIFIP
jgi:hypothetical protein